MKIGLFDHMQKHDNPARSYVDLYRSHLEVLEIADQAGADTFSGEFTFGELTRSRRCTRSGSLPKKSCPS